MLSKRVIIISFFFFPLHCSWSTSFSRFLHLSLLHTGAMTHHLVFALFVLSFFFFWHLTSHVLHNFCSLLLPFLSSFFFFWLSALFSVLFYSLERTWWFFTHWKGARTLSEGRRRKKRIHWCSAVAAFHRVYMPPPLYNRLRSTQTRTHSHIYTKMNPLTWLIFSVCFRCHESHGFVCAAFFSFCSLLLFALFVLMVDIKQSPLFSQVYFFSTSKHFFFFDTQRTYKFFFFLPTTAFCV